MEMVEEDKSKWIKRSPFVGIPASIYVYMSCARDHDAAAWTAAADGDDEINSNDDLTVQSKINVNMPLST